MLVLKREKNGTIVIGDNIFVTVLEIRPDEVTLEIFVPQQVPIRRAEEEHPIGRSANAPGLILLRKKNESVYINNDITITVVEMRGIFVRLGVVTPKEYSVHRREVYDELAARKPALAPGKKTEAKKSDNKK